MCSALSSWRLYSWMRLIWQSKMRVGIDGLPGWSLAASRRTRLGLALGLQEVVAESGVVGQRFRACAAALRSVIQPSPIASVMTLASAGLASSSQRRGVTPLVLLLKRSGKHLGEIGDSRRAQQLRMDRGDAVGAVRADDRQVGHAHLVARALLDQAHARDAGLVAGIAVPDVVEEAAVDLVDDLEHAAADHARTSAPAISRAPRAAACDWCRPVCAA